MSCMHQTDFSLVDKSNIQSSVLMVNQADKLEDAHLGLARMVTTTERGASKSRNLALREAKEEICLFADDDERFIDGLEEKILAVYRELPEADVIIFDLINYKTGQMGTEKRKLNRLDALRIGTPRVSFRRLSVVGRVAFDELLGPGTPTKSSEDIKFVLDCFDAGLQVYFYPLAIAELLEGESSWFSGYTPEFFFNRGRVNRYTLGLPLGTIYGLYWLVAKRKQYGQEMGFYRALGYWLKGWAKADLRKEFHA